MNTLIALIVPLLVFCGGMLASIQFAAWNIVSILEKRAIEKEK